jgi:Fic family protein
MAQEKAGYTWRPLDDLPADWETMSNPELYSLAKVWTEQHAQLKESRSVKDFNEKLLREWSIETGIIERLYTIDRGVTQLLIEQGIDAALIPHGTTDKPVTEIIEILKDHRDALEGIFDFVSRRQPLTVNYVSQLHQIITRSQKYVEGVDQFGRPTKRELIKGDWKKLPNNPTRPDGQLHEYCPPLHVASEMDRLVVLHQQHTNSSIPPEISAAWLHHRFTQIHPFEDGNGRVARALATIVFLQAGWFPIVINRDQRGEYIAALESADHGDPKPLVFLFGQNAKRAFARALELSEDILQGEGAIQDVVGGIVNVYQARRRSIERTYQRVEQISEQLAGEAIQVFEETAREMREKFSAPAIERPPVFKVDRNKDTNAHYYAFQIVDVAKSLGYWANVSRRRIWTRLNIIDVFTQQRAQLVFSFHYLGKTNRGVMVCTGFIYFPETKSGAFHEPDENEENEMSFIESHRICEEPFYFSYQDEGRIASLKSDFRKWLQTATSVGLAEWVQRS